MDSFSTRSPPDEDNDEPSETYSQYDYQHALETDRRLNDQRLKSRFEEIFRKYEHDFSGVGDEIDLETGEIVVNNGHLETLQHETDPGKGESLRLMCALAGSLPEDGIDSEDSSDPEEFSDDQSIDEGMLAEVELEKHTPKAVKASQTRVKETVLIDPQLQVYEARALLTPGESASEDGRACSEPTQLLEPATSHERLFDGAESETAYNEMPGVGEGHIDTLRNFMNELKATVDNETSSTTIKSIGAKIAAQLNELMARGQESVSSDRMKESSDPVWAFPELPQDLLSRREQPLHVDPRQQAAAKITDHDDLLRDSIWAPVIAPRHYKKYRKRRKLTRDGTNRDSEALFAKPASVENIQVDDSPEENMGTSLQVPKSCSHCGIQVTTVWRRGPGGELCNACGMYYYRYGELKPTGETDMSYTSESEPEDESKPRAKTQSFSVKDDALVIKLKEIDNLPWDEIGKQFAGRSWWAVQGRYSRHLHDAPCAGRRLLIEQGYPLHIDRYTPTEDDLVLQLRNDENLDWAVIADRLTGHSKESIEIRHDFLSGRLQIPPRVKRKTVKKNFSAEEDEIIIKLREVEKMSWERIGDMYPGRTSSSLQKRYTRALLTRVEKNTAHNEAKVTIDQNTADIGKGIAERSSTIDKVSEPYLAGEPQKVEHTETDPFLFQPTLVEESHIDPRLLGMEPLHQASSPRTTPEGCNDELIRDLRDNHGLDWDMIQLWVPGSTVASLQGRYYAPPVIQDLLPFSTTIQDQQLQVDTVQSMSDVNLSTSLPLPEESNVYQMIESSRPRGRGKFSRIEDNAIIEGKKQQSSWDDIEASFPTDRPLESIIRRWHKLQSSKPRAIANRSNSSYKNTRSSASSLEGEKPYASRLPTLESLSFTRMPQRAEGSSLNLFNSLLESNNHCAFMTSTDLDRRMGSDEEPGFDLLNMPPITAAHGAFDATPNVTIDDVQGASHGEVQDVHSFRLAEVSHSLSTQPTLQGEEVTDQKPLGLELRAINIESPEIRESVVDHAGEHSRPSPSGRTLPNTDDIEQEVENICEKRPQIGHDLQDELFAAEELSKAITSTVTSPAVGPPGEDAANPSIVHEDPHIPAVEVKVTTTLAVSSKLPPHVSRTALRMTPKSNRMPKEPAEEEKSSTSRGSHRKRDMHLRNIVTPSLMANHHRSRSSADFKASDKRRRRVSRRRSEARRLEIADTDASDCSWDSKQNSSASDTDEDAFLMHDGDGMESPSPVKRLGKLQSTSSAYPAEISGKKLPANSKGLSKQSPMVGFKHGSASKDASTPSRTTPTISRAQSNLHASATKSTFTKLVPGSETKRIVDTPMKEINVNSSEDELA